MYFNYILAIVSDIIIVLDDNLVCVKTVRGVDCGAVLYCIVILKKTCYATKTNNKTRRCRVYCKIVVYCTELSWVYLIN